MKKILLLIAMLSACTHLTHHERNQLKELETKGITVEKPNANWSAPASPAAAGLLNLLPGVGNFYLAAGNAGDSNQYLYGALNLLTWPISVIWGIPEAVIDANNINKRELVYYYTYEKK